MWFDAHTEVTGVLTDHVLISDLKKMNGGGQAFARMAKAYFQAFPNIKVRDGEKIGPMKETTRGVVRGVRMRVTSV